MIQKESCRTKTLVSVHHASPLSLVVLVVIFHFEEKQGLFESALGHSQCKILKKESSASIILMATTYATIRVLNTFHGCLIGDGLMI